MSAFRSACLLALCACTGDIMPAGPGPGPGGSGGSGGAGGGTVQVDPCVGAAPDPGVTPLRRLNRAEYLASIDALMQRHVALMTTIPADEIGDGFDTDVSLQSVDDVRALAYHNAASEVALLIDPVVHGGCTAGEADAACAATFITNFGRRTFRRPLTADETSLFTTLYQYGLTDESHLRGLQLVATAMLESPQFLYRLENDPAGSSGDIVPVEPYPLASRLSYALTGSTPDDALLDAAANGQLSTPDQVRAQAERLLGDARAHAVTERFFTQWLSLDALSRMTKDPSYGDFAGTRDSMLAETKRFTDYAFWETDGRPSQLLDSNVAFVDDKLAAWYGLPAVPAGALTKVTLPAGHQRPGLLTEASLLSIMATPLVTHPVRRGKFVRVQLLCLPLPSAPPSVPPPPPEMLGVSSRERFAEHETPACAGCHQLMDPQGLGMEDFDAAGRYRTMENGAPVDNSGELKNADDATFTFHGGAELSRKLAGTQTFAKCMGSQLYQFEMGRPATMADVCSERRFQAATGDTGMRAALLDWVTSDAFMLRTVP